MRKLLVPIVAMLPLLSGGCIAKTAWDVATLPVKAGAQAVDWTTTSQEESDRNYGKKMREKEAREGKERRKREKECRKHPESCQQSYDGYRASDPD
ncbi:hypothetical protein FHS95_001578 [Sphingomonas naasensis]|uniref:Lipoprotein n=1 Tax=Sphingomonas naasensis TaxID=1344951 RepID=A0A4S1WAT6_9SPHN|nr:hypothetical protein [Sphingomonas naasensis]NIJ19909.1 hypothetical protein [Sphingomonas naasensis]TGX39968.1 hypothetical protein E5A74_15415 [Sphingomonas naasensis]